MRFKEMTDYCQVLAIANKLEPTEESVWRRICRYYARNFNESLSDCLSGKVDAEQILLNVYEDELLNFDHEARLEDLMDLVYSIEDPDYERVKSEDLEEFIEDAEAQEEERIKAGKPIHKAMKNDNILNETSLPSEPPMPTSGGINLSYLEQHENEQ